jgi:hypothetical protein
MWESLSEAEKCRDSHWKEICGQPPRLSIERSSIFSASTKPEEPETQRSSLRPLRIFLYDLRG